MSLPRLVTTVTSVPAAEMASQRMSAFVPPFGVSNWPIGCGPLAAVIDAFVNT